MKFLKPLKGRSTSIIASLKKGRIPVRGVRPRCFNVNYVNN